MSTLLLRSSRIVNTCTPTFGMIRAPLYATCALSFLCRIGSACRLDNMVRLTWRSMLIPPTCFRRFNLAIVVPHPLIFAPVFRGTLRRKCVVSRGRRSLMRTAQSCHSWVGDTWRSPVPASLLATLQSAGQTTASRDATLLIISVSRNIRTLVSGCGVTLARLMRDP